MFRLFQTAVLLSIALPAFGQTQLATRQEAVDAINAAVDARVAWANWAQATETEISNLPPGPVRDAVDLAWGGFIAAWNGADAAAESHIDLANARLAAGDAATDPMLKGLYYAQAVTWANSAETTMDNLEDDYDVFMAAISGTGWSPSTSPPSS